MLHGVLFDFIIAEVPDLNPQLEKLTLSYLEFKGKTDQQTGEVQDLYKKYNKIVSFQR
jgi:Dynactin subunit p22